MKILKFTVLATIITLTGCAADGTSTTATNTASNIGMGIVQSAVKQTCQSQLSKNQYFKIASAAMSSATQSKLSDSICGCVAEKAPQSVSLTEVATAAIDGDARAKLAQKVVVGSLQSCAADTLNGFITKQAS